MTFSWCIYKTYVFKGGQSFKSLKKCLLKKGPIEEFFCWNFCGFWNFFTSKTWFLIYIKYKSFVTLIVRCFTVTKKIIEQHEKIVKQLVCFFFNYRKCFFIGGYQMNFTWCISKTHVFEVGKFFKSHKKNVF